MLLGVLLFLSPAEGREEFRRALLMNASGNPAHAKSIEVLRRSLEAKGFVVTWLPEAEKNGYPAYVRFIRSLPSNGKSLLYYCGDLDIVKEGRSTIYRYRLGDYRFIAPDAYPSRAKSDAELIATPTPTSRDTDGRIVKVVEPVSAQHLMVLDIQTIHDSVKPDTPWERKFYDGRWLKIPPHQARGQTACLNRKENSGPVLAERLSQAL
ncbi:MAG: hypothetical protein AAF492_32615, partial [Verrucomicrobiota bacterium]